MHLKNSELFKVQTKMEIRWQDVRRQSNYHHENFDYENIDHANNQLQFRFQV